MSLNGRLFSLRSQLGHASRLLPRSQTRALNEFISRAPKSETAVPPDTTFRLAVKDNIATLPQDGPTTCASGILMGHGSPLEATIVTQLKKLGATVVGKTNMDEFGMGGHSVNSFYGPVSAAQEHDNDHDETRRSVGGSSGGSAVAVTRGAGAAAAAADVALGTDTGGSVRLPAAYCGVVGYKPSYGMISRYGVVPYANSLDTVGFLADNVEKIHTMVVQKRLFEEHDPRDPTSLSTEARKRCTAARGFYHSGDRKAVGDEAYQHVLRPLTFGIPVEYNIEELEGCVRQAWEDTASFLRDKIGARVVPVSLPSTRHALSAYYVIAPAEASSNLAKYDGVRYGPKQHEIEVKGEDGSGNNGVLYSAVRGKNFGAEVKRRILLGSYTLSSEAIDNYFIQAQRVRQLVRQDFDRVFKLANPLVDEDEQQFSLTDMDENVLLENKFGPTQVDFLLCPTAPTLPPRLEDVQAGQERNPVDAYMNDVFTVPASLAGLPAISIPKTVQGQPDGKAVMGLQIIGQYWDDARLLAAAEALSALCK